MNISRRDFMKLFGVGVASILMTRCRFFIPIGSCYAPMPPSPSAFTPRDRLRTYWLSFNELARSTADAAAMGDTENTYGGQLISDHRLALDELVALGELSISLADLIQEAFEAAVYHFWRSNAPITCYKPAMVDYAPASAELLVQQAYTLDAISDQGTIDPETLNRIRTALERDMAFQALSEADVQALYDKITKASQEEGQLIPSFNDLPLEIPPEAKAAAQFIIDLLSGK
jgi:hypothetical protein